METKYGKAIFAASVLSMVLGYTQIRAATQYPPEGGQWNYGVGVLGSYSDYINQQLYHGSTVNHNGVRYPAEAPAGKWSQALANGIYSGCSFYYNIYQ